MISFFNKLAHQIVFRHFFIAACAVSMVLATELLNHSALIYSPYTFFLAGATFLIYNFHTESFFLDFRSTKQLYDSVKDLRLSALDVFFYVFGAAFTLFFFFELSNEVKLMLIPLGVLTILYSVPFWGNRRRKLRELLFVKIPLLSLIWSFTTVIFPAVEQNIDVNSPFVIQQLICRFLFIFALCVPFEIRDVEIDRSKNVRTIPVVYGTRLTKHSGIVILLIEMVIHHWMPTSMGVKIALDLSSVFAIIWILMQKEEMSGYFFKVLVDGTMILRFLFLYIAIGL